MSAPATCSSSGFADCLSTKLAKINSKTVLFQYFPIAGAVSYVTLSVNVMNPNLILRMSPTRDVTNVLLGLSVAGTLFYIYDRPHLKHSCPTKRIMYSGFGSVVFNFGSVLLWAVLRSSTRSNCVATVIGLASGAGLAFAGLNYLQYIDKISDKSPDST